MIAAATRQDLQNALERTRNSIVGSMLSRQDAQTVVAQLRTAILQDMRELHAENGQTIRQGQVQHDQLMARLNSIEHNIHSLQQTMVRFLETQARYTNSPYR